MLDPKTVLAAIPMRRLKGMIREALKREPGMAVDRESKIGFALGELLAEQERRDREDAPPLKPRRTAQTIREEREAERERIKTAIREEMATLPQGLPGVAYVNVGATAIARGLERTAAGVAAEDDVPAGREVSRGR